jgi:hypothetical protein
MSIRRAGGLAEVIDCRDRADEVPAFTILGTGDLLRGGLAWEFSYQIVLEGGELGLTLQVRQVFADDERQAIYELQKLLYGFGVLAIRLFAVRPPATPADLAFLRDANRQLAEWRAGKNGQELVFA